MTGCSASSGEMLCGIFSSPKAETPSTLKMSTLWYATIARPLSDTIVGCFTPASSHTVWM
jgi:hypothetical protein